MFAPSKQLVGAYSLYKRETGRFALGGLGKRGGDLGGYVDGTVDSVGWSDAIVLVHRDGPVFGSADSAGWMVVDVRSGQVRGPLRGAGLARDPALSRVRVRGADVVWEGR